MGIPLVGRIPILLAYSKDSSVPDMFGEFREGKMGWTVDILACCQKSRLDQLMVNWWFRLVVWIFGIRENESGIGILRDTPIRIPNHRAPNHPINH